MKTKRTISRLSLTASAAALVIGCPAFGQQVVFDNLSSPTSSNRPISSLFDWAQGFQAPDTDSVLSSVTLKVRNTNAATGTFTVQLYSGFGSIPGTLLATLSGPANPQSGLATFVPTGLVPLLADQTYWVSAYSTSATDPDQFYGWSIANNAPTGGTSYGSAGRQRGGGGGWESGPGDLMLQVQTMTPAPEPTSAALLLGGTALLALRRRRSPAGA
jgi:hypothetical protein